MDGNWRWRCGWNHPERERDREYRARRRGGAESSLEVSEGQMSLWGRPGRISRKVKEEHSVRVSGECFQEACAVNLCDVAERLCEDWKCPLCALTWRSSVTWQMRQNPQARGWRVVRQKWACLRSGSPKRILSWFDFKWFMWQTIPGSNSEGEGKWEGKGRKPVKGEVLSILLLCAAVFSPRGHLWETVWKLPHSYAHLAQGLVSSY